MGTHGHQDFRHNALIGHALRRLHGRGVGENKPEAVRLLRLAARKGNTIAYYHLGLCYLTGGAS